MRGQLYSSSITRLRPPARVVAGSRRALSIRAEKDFAKDVGGTTVTEEMLKTERYIATNRFKVKPNAGAKFEQRWATRKSRIADLDGFRYFHLMRRVPRRDGEQIPGDDYNYVSFTIWDDRKSFQSWMSGDAFKEAHGGGTIFGFIDMLVNATFTLNGAPKPAFWHGLLPISLPGDMSDKQVENGWRKVDADGKNKLESEAFAVANRFSVAEGSEIDFEQRWAKRESKLKQMPGFKAFTMCRRDGKQADDGYNYQSFTIWQDRASFENWTKSQEFSHAHQNVRRSGSDSASSNGSNGAAQPQKQKGPPPMSGMKGPPSPAFYECVLVLESDKGA